MSALALAIAGAAAQGRDVIPVVGMTRRSCLDDALTAMAASLDADDLAAVDRAVPADSAAGERYAPQQMAPLDSERRQPSVSQR